MNYLVLFIAFLGFFVGNGKSLKCYICETPEECKNPVPRTCPTRNPPFEECLYTRIKTKDNVVKKEWRICSQKFSCNEAYLCNEAGANDTCIGGCCKDDLCNNLNFVPPKQETFEPSGSNLSCYTCTDMPTDNTSIFKSPRKCSDSPQHAQICSPNPVRGFKNLKQDRCLTLKLKVKNKAGVIEDKVVKNCSDAMMCDYSSALWLYAMNQSNVAGVISASGSCCSGNLCHQKGPGNSSWRETCFSGLLLSLVVVSFYLCRQDV